MTAGFLLILYIYCLTLTSATVYNYNETSERVPFLNNDALLGGFRDVINKDFILGGLFPVYDCADLTVGDLESLEAMLFAIDRVNNDNTLLPNLVIGYDVRDTCTSEIAGFRQALDIIIRLGNSSAPLLGIIGPAANSVTLPIANLFDLYRIPMVSYASSSATLSNKNLFGYFLRTVPSSNLQAHAMADLISHFGWGYVSVIFTDDYEYGDPGSDTFIDSAMQHKICVDVKLPIPPLEESKTNYEEFNKSIEKAISMLLSSKASVVVVFTDEQTVLALFEELSKRNTTDTFVWIASDKWINSDLVNYRFPEIANGTFGFRLLNEHVKEFDDYFSQLTSITNIRDQFFQDYIYYTVYCNRSRDCPDDLTDDPNYLQDDAVPFVIDAVYVFAHAIQNFLDDNCDSPLRWKHTTQQCDG